MEFNLNVTEAEVDIIGQALAELPYKQSAPLMQKLIQQIKEQQTKENTP
jgi:hypothetical protein